MPDMKLETTFCRPKPMPTPTAPEKTVRAVFTPQQFLQNVDWNPVRGTVKGGGSGYYDYGTEVTWTAQPAEGYYFKGWAEGSMHAEVSHTLPTITFTVSQQGYYSPSSSRWSTSMSA